MTFSGHKYLNLETYRRNGTPVATPVWFAEERGVFYIYSLAGAGKVKRIRNNPQVRIAPCDIRGKPRGEWAKARARIASPEEARRAHQLLNRKYPLKRLFDLARRFSPKERVVIAIEIP